MLKTHYGQRTVAEAMIDYLNHCEDWDEQIVNQGESLRRFGRRLVYTSDFGREEYIRCDSIEEALKEFEYREFPDEYDAWVSEGYSRNEPYHVSCEQCDVGSYATRDEAEYALASYLCDTGVFPDTWYFNERGNYDRLDVDKYIDWRADGNPVIKISEQEIDIMRDSYIETLLWSETAEVDGETVPLDDVAGVDDIDAESLKSINEDVRRFVLENFADVVQAISERSLQRVGHDFCLTRNGHGAGFWDGGYSDELGKRLTQASKGFGSVDATIYESGYEDQYSVEVR